MKHWLGRTVCVAVLSVSSASLAAESGVNWEGQVLKATGSGAPDMKASSPAQARLGAERAAQMDAFRALLAQAKGIRITAGETMDDVMSSDDEVRGKVEGVLRGFKIAAKRYYSDQGVEMDVEVPLSALTELLPSPPSATAAESSPPKADSKNTGLLVDARALKVTPALSPRLIDVSGKTLYGVETLSADARKSSGVAAYVKGLDAAKKQHRVGERPLVVKASKVDGTDLIIDADEAKKIGPLPAYLAEGRVVIVTQ